MRLGLTGLIPCLLRVISYQISYIGTLEYYFIGLKLQYYRFNFVNHGTNDNSHNFLPKDLRSVTNHYY